MLSLRLDPDVERRLGALARMTGRTKSFYARALIEENLEDLEDRYIAEARLEKRRPTLTRQPSTKSAGPGTLDRIRELENRVRSGRVKGLA
jgi:RHH-type transcriptional regulator, rel operon repressor / antitoxin RelB